MSRVSTSDATSISRQDTAGLIIRSMSNDLRRRDSHSGGDTHRAAAAASISKTQVSSALRERRASMPSCRHSDSANSFTRGPDGVADSNSFGSTTSVRDSLTEDARGKVGSIPRESGRNASGDRGGGGSARATAASDRGSLDGGSASGGGGSGGGSDGDGDGDGGSPAVSAGGTSTTRGDTRRLRTYPNSHVCRLARMALDVQALMAGYKAPDGGLLCMRIGLHVGATVGGVVGKKMLRYHLFGPPLEGVTRMEQACDHGGIRQGRATIRPISVYRFPRRALTLCLQLYMGIQPLPAFTRGLPTLCPQLCMGISPRPYIEIGLLLKISELMNVSFNTF